MIQDTSLENWYLIQRSLGRSQKQVLEALRSQPNATNAEVAYMLQWPINRVTPRMNELQPRMPGDPPERIRIGLIEEIGKRKCRVTGRTAIAWKAVPMPSAFEKPEPKKESKTNQELF